MSAALSRPWNSGLRRGNGWALDFIFGRPSAWWCPFGVNWNSPPVSTAFREIGTNPELLNRKEEKFGATPLFVATFTGHKDIVEILLANKASVNVTDDRCRTPLRVALADGQKKEIADLLVQYWAREESEFYQAAAKNSLIVQVPDGFKEVPVLENRDADYGYALGNAELGCEIRLRIEQVDTSPLRPEEIRADMNKLYPAALYVLMMNIAGAEPEKFYQDDSADDLKSYNADAITIARTGIKSNGNKDVKSFAEGFGYCMAIVIHRDNVADGYIICLYKDKATYERTMRDNLGLEDGLKFMKKSGSGTNQ